jgi:hypothetical protein
VQSDVTAYVDKVNDKPLLEKKPIPSKVVKENKIDAYNITEWTLANGINVIFKTYGF